VSRTPPAQLTFVAALAACSFGAPLAAPALASAEQPSPAAEEASASPRPAGPFAVHVEGAATLGTPGGALLASAELPLDPHFGLEVTAGGALETGEETGTTAPDTTLVLFPALRMRPFPDYSSPQGGLWLAAGVGVGYEQGSARTAVALRAGFDVTFGPLAVGPFFGFLHLPAANEAETTDAHVLLLAGLHGVLGGEDETSVAAASSPENQPPAPPLKAPGIVADSGSQGAEPPPGPAPTAPPRAAPEPTPAPEPSVPSEQVRLEETVHFPINDARIGFLAAAAFRRALERLPSQGLVRVIVEGHSDTTGGVAYNQTLSLARARSVQAILVDLGIPSEIVVVEGLAASRPADPGRDPGALARNRRVEIVVERHVTTPPPTPSP
jgi:outer membrane protein OmpA-like peptidoglycan-associated protein